MNKFQQLASEMSKVIIERETMHQLQEQMQRALGSPNIQESGNIALEKKKTRKMSEKLLLKQE